MRQNPWSLESNCCFSTLFIFSFFQLRARSMMQSKRYKGALHATNSVRYSDNCIRRNSLQVGPPIVARSTWPHVMMRLWKWGYPPPLFFNCIVAPGSFSKSGNLSFSFAQFHFNQIELITVLERESRRVFSESTGLTLEHELNDTDKNRFFFVCKS